MVDLSLLTEVVYVSDVSWYYVEVNVMGYYFVVGLLDGLGSLGLQILETFLGLNEGI